MNNMLPAISSLIKRNNFSPEDRKLLMSISGGSTNSMTNEEIDLITNEIFGISTGSGGSGSGINIIGEV